MPQIIFNYSRRISRAESWKFQSARNIEACNTSHLKTLSSLSSVNNVKAVIR